MPTEVKIKFILYVTVIDIFSQRIILFRNKSHVPRDAVNLRINYPSISNLVIRATELCHKIMDQKKERYKTADSNPRYDCCFQVIVKMCSCNKTSCLRLFFKGIEKGVFTRNILRADSHLSTNRSLLAGR